MDRGVVAAVEGAAAAEVEGVAASAVGAAEVSRRLPFVAADVIE